MKWIWLPQLQKHWGLLVSSLAFGIANAVLTVLAFCAFHRVFQSGNSELDGWLFLTLCFSMFGTRLLCELCLNRFSEHTTVGLISGVSERVLSIRWIEQDAARAQRIATVLTEDVLNLSVVFSGLPNLLMNGVVLIGVMIFIFWVSIWIGAGICVTFVLGAFLYAAISFRAQKQFDQARACRDDLMWHFQTIVDGSRELRMSASLNQTFQQSLTHFAREFGRSNRHAHNLYSIGSSWGPAFLLLMIAALLTARNRVALDDLEIASISIATLYLINPISVLISWMPRLGVAKSSLKTLASLEMPPLSEHPVARSIQVSNPPQTLQLRDATYRHRQALDRDSCFQLGPINLTLHPGEITFITGGNGSGKTTLLHLLSGLVQCDEGAILLGDQTITTADMESYREMVAVAFAEGFVFGPTFFQDVEEIRSQTLLQRLSLQEHFREMNEPFSPIRLSRGQRHRMLLFETLIRNRPIVLFDEWAASQDQRAKDLFYKELLPELASQNKIVIVITHDEAFYGCADRVIQISDGRVSSSSVSVK